MKYIIKVCKNEKCKKEFKTRPFYNKEYCKKCWNTIRMGIVYRKIHSNRRIIFVSGDSTESKRQWAKRNYEKVKMMKLRYRYERGGRIKDKEWQKKNLEKVKASKKKWDSLNKEYKSKWHLEDRKNNPEKYKEIGKVSYRKNPERYKESCRRRRIKKLECGGFHTCKEFNELKVRTGNICVCCGVPESELKNIYRDKKYWKLTEDHIIPLTKGGNDNISNIQSLCLHCNGVKNNKIISLDELRKIL